MKPNKQALLIFAAGAVVLFGLFAVPDHAAPAASEDSGMAMEAEYIGAETCVTCHDDVEEHLALTPHGSDAFAELSDQGCESCHGPGSLHMDDPENPAYQLQMTRWTPQRQAEACLTCHADDQPRFAASEHARTGMSCTGCHSVHGDSGWTYDGDDDSPFATSRISGPSAMCAECHLDVAADFELTERHRLQEGILDCTSCHDPHAPATRVRLGSFKQDACVECHADKGGPFVFEHGGVRVEGCVACHSPHGSPNRHLLAHQNVAELCYSCHVEVPGFHIASGRFSLDTRCTNCHSSIHGSNFSPVFFK
jgi:DmsE family decaheme c-type cytochrome